MGVTKTDQFTNEQNAVSELAKAIAHPARVAILEHLIESDSCITGDLVDVLPLSQATVSQHLKELKKVGLIQGEIQGTSVCYCLNKETWARCISTFNIFFDRIRQASKCC
jgi:DNA-binding transcriptional ArsR family regulator